MNRYSKLKTVSPDLRKVSNVVEKDVKKSVFGKLATKVKVIEISGFVLNTKH